MTAAPAAGGIVINELLTNPVNVNWDNGSQPLQAQWLEMFNTTAADVSIGNWRLTTSTADQAHAATFGAGVTVPAHGYRVFFKHDVLGLDLSQGPVTLRDANGAAVDSVSPPTLPADESYARLPDGAGNWVISPSPTLGSANTATAPIDGGPDMTATVASTQATVLALQTAIAEPLPSPPATPDPSEVDLLDATEIATHVKPRRTPKAEAFRTLPIGAVRSLADNAAVITSGVVTLAPGSFEAQRGYIQLDGAGILIHSYGGTILHVGDGLTIKGRVHHYRGEVEVAAIKNGEQVSGGATLPDPVTIAPGAVGPENEGLLVQIAGQVQAVARDYLTVADGEGSGKVYLYTRLGFLSGSLPSGRQVSVVGVVNASETNTGASHRLVPRTSADIAVADGGAETAAAGANQPGSEASSTAAGTRASGAQRAPGRSSSRAGSRGPAARTITGGLAFPAATAKALGTPILSARRGQPAASLGEPGTRGIIDLGTVLPSQPAWLALAGAAVGGIAIGGGAFGVLAWHKGWRPRWARASSGPAVHGDDGAADDGPAV